MIEFKEIKIQLGSNIELNSDIEKKLGWKPGQIFEKTGIKQRFISSGCETAETLAISAFSQLSESEINGIDTIVSVTNTPSKIFPNISNFIFTNSKIEKDVHCLGINAGCTGYVDALRIIYSLFASNQSKKAVIITSDTYSKFIAENDRSIRSLFSDGATATIIEKNPKGFRVKNSIFSSKKNTESALMRNAEDGIIEMNGPKVLQFALTKVSPEINKILDKTSNCNIFPHQAGKIVLDALSKNISKGCNLYTNYDEVGNLVSSSVPKLIYDNFKKFNSSRFVLLSGFGVGLSHSSVLLEK
jgi:3-oxoacyl-[acyl-carrier-protein] synthase-3